MGGKCPHRKVKKRRLSHKSARRTKFLHKGDDTIHTELKKVEGEMNPLPVDEDLPGMGQFYCLHCDRYFANAAVRDDHFRSKRHKKRAECGTEETSEELKSRMKLMTGPAPHTQLDAELAAGMGMPDNGPKLMS